MVELARSSHGCSIGRLRYGLDDACGRFDPEPSIRTAKLPSLPPDGLDNAYPILHQQHADQVDRQYQLLRVDVQHRGFDRSHHYHTRGNESRRSRPA